MGMNIRMISVLIVLTGSLLLVAYNCRQGSIAHNYNDLKYAVSCEQCGIHYELTVAEMNSLIRRGDTVAPAYQQRRFKCQSCGKISVVPVFFSATGYGVAPPAK